MEKSVVWMGDSLKQVKSFPEEVRKDIGSSLYEVQLGDKPHNAKPFRGVGTGVFEIVTRFDSDTYRTVYAVQIGNSILRFRKNHLKVSRQHRKTLT